MVLAGAVALAKFFTNAPDLKKQQRMRPRDRATRPAVGKGSASESPLSDFLTVKFAAEPGRKSFPGP